MVSSRSNRTARVLLGISLTSLLLSALVAVWLIATFLPPAPRGTRDVTVPQLTGALYDPQDERLDRDVYDVTVEYRTDASVQKGMVLSQNPSAGATRRVVPGQRRCALYLTISAGEPTLTMPDLIGKSATIAALQLQQMGLSVIRKTQSTAQYTPGQIICTEPPAETKTAIRFMPGSPFPRLQ